MTQEEQLKIQAKAYTELINRLEDVKDAIKKQNYGIAMDILYKPYPEFQITTSTELKESERIRKALFEMVHDTTEHELWIGYDVHKEDALNWLEAQGEHANFCNKIQVGDKVTRNEDSVLVNLSQLNRVAKKDEKQGKNNMGISEATKQKLEDNLNKALEKETPESWNKFLDEQNSSWSEEDEKQLNDIISLLPGLDIRHNWLKSLKDRVQQQSKQEWNKDTQQWIDAIIKDYEGRYDADKDHRTTIQAKINILKSLRPQSTWKPSDEQMHYLSWIANIKLGDSVVEQEVSKRLNELLEDLKKLKG